MVDCIYLLSVGNNSKGSNPMHPAEISRVRQTVSKTILKSWSKLAINGVNRINKRTIK